MMDFMKRLEPMLIDMYLPEHIKQTFSLLGLNKQEVEDKVKEIMGDPEKKQQFMDFVMSRKDEDTPTP